MNERISSAEIDLGQGSNVCYLIHGFTGSTYELRGLAEFLASHGLRVVAKLLPGHGTTMEECNRVTAEEYLEFTEVTFAELATESDAIFAIGLSMGADLALHLAALFPVSGVVAMAPVFIFNSWKTRWLAPLMAPFRLAMPKDRWYDQLDVNSPQPYGYSGYPLKATRQVVRLTEHIHKSLPGITAPALILHSHADVTSPFENANLVYKAISSEKKTLIEYQESSHILPDDSEKAAVWEAILHFIRSHTTLPAF